MFRLNTIDRVQLAILLLLAFTIRVYKLGLASFWLDEIGTILKASLSLDRLWVSAYDPTPPLYYSIIKLLLPFGHSEFLLRFPSVIFGTLTVAVIYCTTRKLAGPLAALVAGLILTLSFHNIEYSQEARAYALLGFCLSLSLLGLIDLGTRWKTTGEDFSFPAFITGGAGLYALGLTAALYSHNTAVFFWIGTQFFFLAWWAGPFRWSRACLAGWITVNLVVLLLWMPWFFTILQVMDNGMFSWLKQAEPAEALGIWLEVHGLPKMLLVNPVRPYFDFALLGLGLTGLYSLRHNIPLLTLFVALIVFSSLGIWAYGLFSTPVFMLRTILWGTLLSAILVAIGVSRLPGYAAYAALLCLLAGLSAGVIGYFRTNHAENEQWRQTVAFFSENQQPNDILLFRNTYVANTFAYYLHSNSQGWDIFGWDCSGERLFPAEVVQASPVNRVEYHRHAPVTDLPLAPKAGASLWVIEAHCWPRDREIADDVFYPNWRLVGSHKFKGVNLHQLAPSSGR